jgi:hypothetical protein
MKRSTTYGKFCIDPDFGICASYLLYCESRGIKDAAWSQAPTNSPS